MSDTDHVAAARAVYDATAETYVRFVGTEVSTATEGALDRSLLDAFVELVAAGGRVADVGCGTGRVAAFLAARGVDVIGVDVSPAMLDVARRAHPGIPFEEGRLTALPFGDRSLAGAVCWYAIIYTPPERLDEVCAELARVLHPAGHLLLAFQAGDGEGVHRAEAFGSPFPLTSYRHSPDDVTRRLAEAGLHLHARAVREAAFAHESTPQAFLLARAGHRA